MTSARLAYALLAGTLFLTAGILTYAHYARRPPAPDAAASGGEPRTDPVTGKGVDSLTGRPRGKLAVLVVFDQLRADYLERWAEYFGPGGFERVKKQGTWFTQVHVPYACTSTGPGHASVVTGAPPSVTGIVENEWWDRRVGERVYCCQPLNRPYGRVPPLPAVAGPVGRGTDAGFAPERLLAETVGDRLKAVTHGKARVFSLSLKDRTAVLMGGRNPDGVYCFDTRDGIFHTGMYYREQVHPWVAAFNATKAVDAWFGQKWEQSRPDLDYRLATGQPDEAVGEGYGQNGQGRLFPHPFRGKLTAPARGYYEAVECSPAGNELLLRLAQRAIEAEELGRRDTADLLCLSFSSNDLVGHHWGPDSWEVFDITLRSDRLVAELIDFLDAKVGRSNYTLALTADHGVAPIPEQERFPSAQRLSVAQIYPLLAQKLDDAFGIPPAGPTAWFQTTDPKDQDRLWPWVHLNHKALADRGLKPEEVAPLVRDWCAGRAFVEAAFTREELELGNYPPGSPGDRARLAYHPERCGDVLVVVKPGVLVTSYPYGTNHGTPHPYDTHVPVLALGAGIPAGTTRTAKTSSLIVAPILAQALGIDPPRDAVEKSPF